MKIEKIIENSGVLKQNDAARSGKGSDDFTRLLNEELHLSKPCPPPVDGIPESLLLDSSLRIPSLNLNCYPAGDAAKVENEVSTAIDRLETIEQQLREDSATLRDIDGTLAELKAQSLALAQNAAGLPPGHPLRRIAEDLSVLTSVESIKWKRGDYL